MEEESRKAGSSPDLKLVPSLDEKPRAQAYSPKKKKTSPVLMLLFFSTIAFGAYFLYFKRPKVDLGFQPPPVSATAPAPKLEGDDLIYQEAIDFYKAKDYAKALVKFELLLKTHPKDDVILNNLGLTYFKNSDFKKAEEYFQEVLKIDPKNGAAYSNLGTLKMAQFKSDDAIFNFYQAILYHPDLIEPHLNLAKAFELAGRPMEAVPEYQYYLDHTKIGGDASIRALIEKRIVKLNALSRVKD